MPHRIPPEVLDRRPAPGHELTFWRLAWCYDGTPSIRPRGTVRQFLSDPTNQDGTWLFSDGHFQDAYAEHLKGPHMVRWGGRRWEWGGQMGKLFEYRED